MSRCSDPAIENMLHAYELGMLSDEDRMRLEVHLIECESCYQTAQKLADAAQLMRHDSHLRERVRQIAEEEPETAELAAAEGENLRPARRRWPRFTPVFVAAAAVLLLLILRPWEVQIRPSKEAVAVENRLAVMYFSNVSDPSDSNLLGAMATNLLVTDLTESQYLNVIPLERLAEIARQYDAGDIAELPREKATEIARHANAVWVLFGTVPQVDDQVRLDVELVDIATGEVIATNKAACDSAASLFCVVDKMTPEVKRALPLPDSALIEYDPSVADITTNSPEAYRYYVQGKEQALRWNKTEAAKSFRKALEYDSTLAMAYYQLAGWGQTPAEQWQELLARAMEYSNKASWKEQQWIKSRYAYVNHDYRGAVEELKNVLIRFPEDKGALQQLASHQSMILRELDKAVHSFRRVLELDSLEKVAYLGIGYAYGGLGDYVNALEAMNRYIALAPDQHNPYDSRGDIYSWHGRLDEAISDFERSSLIGDDFSLMRLGQMYLYKGSYEQADSCFVKLSSHRDADMRSEGLTSLAFVPLYQSKFTEALDILQEGIAADSVDGYKGHQRGAKHLLRATIYQELGKYDSALVETKRLIDAWEGRMVFYPPRYGRDLYVQLLADQGKLVESKETIDSWDFDSTDVDQPLSYWYWYSVGCLRFAQNDYESAVVQFQRAIDHSYSKTWFGEFWLQVMLFRSLHAAGRVDDAIALGEQTLVSYDYGRSLWLISSVKLHYWLAQAYETAGNSDDAITQYEQFLRYWGDAEPQVDAVVDAKQRLERLKTVSRQLGWDR